MSGRYRQPSSQSFLTRPTITKVFHKAPRTIAFLASARPGFSMKDTTDRGRPFSPFSTTPGSIQPYSRFRLSGRTPRGITRLGNLSTATAAWTTKLHNAPFRVNEMIRRIDDHGGIRVGSPAAKLRAYFLSMVATLGWRQHIRPIQRVLKHRTCSDKSAVLLRPVVAQPLLDERPDALPFSPCQND